MISRLLLLLQKKPRPIPGPRKYYVTKDGRYYHLKTGQFYTTKGNDNA